MNSKKTKEQGPAFVGISKLLSEHGTFVHILLISTWRQGQQLADFEKWASAGRWDSIHSHHYDWFACSHCLCVKFNVVA